MSSSNSILALPDCLSSTAVEEPSNHVFFQDIHEYQGLPGTSSPNGLNSNTEIQYPPTQTQSQDDPGHQNNNESNVPPAPLHSGRREGVRRTWEFITMTGFA